MLIHTTTRALHRYPKPNQSWRPCCPFFPCISPGIGRDKRNGHNVKVQAGVHHRWARESRLRNHSLSRVVHRGSPSAGSVQVTKHVLFARCVANTSQDAPFLRSFLRSFNDKYFYVVGCASERSCDMPQAAIWNLNRLYVHLSPLLAGLQQDAVQPDPVWDHQRRRGLVGRRSQGCHVTASQALRGGGRRRP